jgi:GT2 family glycosyltransferase
MACPFGAEQENGDVSRGRRGNSGRLSAIIVTHNNAAMLAAVLEDLGRQTKPLHEVVVVDNSDGIATRSLMRERPCVTYIRMAENVGTAGGFGAGLAHATPRCDLVLTLDDDVRIPPESVEKLYEGFLALKAQNPRVGAVRAVGACHPARYPSKLSDFAWRGTLIDSAAIASIGLPRKSYFMYADDLEFSLRLIEKGYEIFDMPGSRVIEQPRPGKLRKMVFGRALTCYADGFRFYYAFRNTIDAYRSHGRYRAMIRTGLYAAKILVFFGLVRTPGWWSCFQAILGGVRDGLRSRFGKNPRFLPASDFSR